MHSQSLPTLIKEGKGIFSLFSHELYMPRQVVTDVRAHASVSTTVDDFDDISLNR